MPTLYFISPIKCSLKQIVRNAMPKQGINIGLGILWGFFRRKADPQNRKDLRSLAFWWGSHSCCRFWALKTLYSHLQWDKARRGSLFRVQVLLWPSQNNSDCNTVGPPRMAKPSSLRPVTIITLTVHSFLGKPGPWIKFSVNTQSCVNPFFYFSRSTRSLPVS